jgi:hypothetical protein
MAEEWELKELKRRLEALENENSRRSERLNRWITAIMWTLYVVALTTYVVLGATGNLHHH